MSRKTFGPVLTAAIMTLFLCLGAQAATIDSDITDTADNEYNWTEATEITNGATVTFTHTQKLSGPITITDGTLNLGKENGFASVTSITVGSNGTLNFSSKSPFGTDSNPRKFTIEEGGVLDFTANNGTFANIAEIVLNGGTVQCSSTSIDANYGAFLFRDSVTANADSEITAPFTVRSGWGNNGGKPTWTVAENATLTISGGVRFQDTGANPDYPIITKAGAGTLLITSAAKAVHASTEFIISGGTLKFTNVNSLQSGSNAMKITVNNGKLVFEGSGGTIKNNIVIAEGQNVEFKSTSGELAYTGSLTGKGTFRNTQTEWMTLNLKGNNTAFEGTIQNTGLMFFTGVNSAVPQGKFVGNGTVCFLPADAANSVFQFGELSGNGTLRPSINSAANYTLQIGGLNTDSTFSGKLADYDDGNGQDYARSMKIEKVGTGTLTLTNNTNNYRGGTVVSAGTLAFTAVGALGRGSVTVGADPTTDVPTPAAAKLSFSTSGESRITKDILVNQSGTFEIVTKNGQAIYAGSLTGTGTVTGDTSKAFVRFTGDNSAFAGTVRMSGGNHTFFSAPQSASENVAYIISTPTVFLNTEADQVYKFGALQMTGWEWRFSNETPQGMYSATLQIGNLGQDDLLQTFLQANIKLEKVGDGTLTIKQNGTNNNTFSGGTVVHAGTVDATYPKALGSGAVSVEGGTLKYTGGTTTFTNNTTVGTDGTFQLDKAGTTLTVTGTLAGDGKIDVQNGTFYYQGKEGAVTTTFAQDINIGENGKFQYDHGSTLSGDLTGSGIIQNSGGWSYYTGNNSAFEGTFQLNDLAFFQNGESSSGKATFQGNGPIILKVTDAAKNTYEFGKTAGSLIIRPSGSSIGEHYVKIGGTGEDFTYSGVLCDYTDKTSGLIKTGAGTVTLTADFSKAATIANDTSAKPYSLGTTIEDGRLVIAEGAVIGADKGDLVLVNAVSDVVNPAITLNGMIRGDLQIDGLLTIDFSDANNPVGTVTGDVTFGDLAGLQAIFGDDGWDPEMTYTLNSSNSNEVFASMTRLCAEAIEAGTLPSEFSVMATAGGVILGLNGEAGGVPEPAAWVLLVLGMAGMVCASRRQKRGK
ncbi:MAG: autotransporter-associated beta strand repeat-containing protein [Thermoguttaceae bacterium]|nr:autotransporter-associated beta strand repeat-containing protein [Thermoguttaceae bacterium]